MSGTVWKVEYVVYDKGGDALAYMDTIDGAIEYCKARKAEKVTRITHYNTEYDDIWENSHDVED